jgi:hypothetical protein
MKCESTCRLIARLAGLLDRLVSYVVWGPAPPPQDDTTSALLKPFVAPLAGWTPSIPDYHGEAIEELIQRHPVVVVHLWAIWDSYDKPLDEAIDAVKDRFSGHIIFASCNTDLPENVDFTRRCGVVTIPYLALFFSGRLRYGLVGLRSADQLASDLDYALSEPKRPARRWAFWRSSSRRPGFVWYWHPTPRRYTHPALEEGDRGVAPGGARTRNPGEISDSDDAAPN